MKWVEERENQYVGQDEGISPRGFHAYALKKNVYQ